MIDRSAMLADIEQRNAVRRQAQLPLLDVSQEFRRAIEQAHWKAVCEEHGDRVYSEVLTEVTRNLKGPPRSAGGRWAVDLLTQKRLAALYNATFPDP